MNYICRLIYFFANQVPCVESHDPHGHERGEEGRDPHQADRPQDSLRNDPLHLGK